MVDTHLIALSSPNPVDVISDDRHNVKPWFQGKLPFAFNMPEVQGSNFDLIGGKVVYVQQRPGAALLYRAGQHKISIFIFQSRDRSTKAPNWNHDVSFTASSWATGGRDCYLISDASRDEAGKLITMFQEANQQ